MKTMFVTGCTVLLACAAIAPVAVRAEVTDQDKQFLAMAGQSDYNEIKLSKLAEMKASNPQVKAFAHKMVRDHDVLEVKMKPFATAWNITPPTGLDADHQAEYDKLSGLSGADFDKEYISALQIDHHKALDAFTNEANTTTDMKFKQAVVKGKSVVAMHTEMVDKM